MSLELLLLLYSLNGCNKVETKVVPCTEGQIETKSCGPNDSGTELRTCEDRKWSEWSKCDSEDLCVDRESFDLDFCDLNYSIVDDIRSCENKINVTLGCDNGVYTVGLDRDYADVPTEGEGEVIEVPGEGEGEGEVIEIPSEGEGEGEIIEVPGEGEGEVIYANGPLELISPENAISRLPVVSGDNVAFIYRNEGGQHLVLRNLESGEVNDRLLDSGVGEVTALDLDGDLPVFTDGLSLYVSSPEHNDLLMFYWGIGGQGVIGSVFDLKASNGLALLSGNFVSINGLSSSSGFVINDYSDQRNNVSSMGIGIVPPSFDFSDGFLTYVKLGAGNGLYLLNLGVGETALDNEGLINSPIINSGKVAYVSRFDARKKIKIINLDGSEKVDVADGVNYLYAFNGNRILYGQNKNNKKEYYISNLSDLSLSLVNLNGINVSRCGLNERVIVCADGDRDKVYSSLLL